MKVIKKIEEFLDSQDSKAFEDDNKSSSEDLYDLTMDMEEIGMSEKTYTKDMLLDAMSKVNFSDYVEVKVDDQFSFHLDSTGYSSTKVYATFEGSISAKFDTSSMWDAVSSHLYPLSRKREDLEKESYTMDEMELAFLNYRWDNVEELIQNDYDAIEVNLDVSEGSDGIAHIDAESLFDDSDIDYHVDQKEIMDDILGDL